MATIWKATIHPYDGTQQIKVPVNATFLCAGLQHNDVCLWYKCDPSKSIETRHIRVFGTGHPIPDTGVAYIGTVIQSALVWHVFEDLEAGRS